jgi:hypothetical protein
LTCAHSRARARALSHVYMCVCIIKNFASVSACVCAFVSVYTFARVLRHVLYCCARRIADSLREAPEVHHHSCMFAVLVGAAIMSFIGVWL